MPELVQKPKAKAKGQQDLASEEIRRHEALKAYRDTRFKPAWQTLSQYYLPNFSDINTEKTEGTSGWSDNVYDTTAIEDARTCTTGQSNWATPSAEPWFAYSPPKALNIQEDDEAALWCAEFTDWALEELARSNYYPMSGIQYMNRTVFGTGQLHIEEGKSRLINCTTRKIGTYCIALDEEGLADTIYAEFTLSARAARMKFGEDVGPKLRKAMNDPKSLDKEFTFLHVIRPREELEREPGKIDAENKPIASLYINLDDKWIVKEGGYDEMPESVTRFSDWGTGTVWGYSPAFETLPNVRQLNYVVRFMDAQYELRANPRLLIPVGMSGQVDLRPGGMTFFDPNLPENGMPQEWVTQADIKSTEESAEKKRQAIHRMFYTDVFKALSQMQQTYRRPPTAYEIQKLLGESLEQLSPMFGRLLAEKADPDLKRVFGILYRSKRFRPAPRSMFTPSADGRKLQLAMPDISYTSRLALALKAQQNKATVDVLQFASEFAQSTGRIEILDNFDLDGTIRKFSLAQGMSAEALRPMKGVLQIRAARAKQQEQERALAAAEQISKSAKNLGGAPEKIQDQVAQSIPTAAA